VEERWSNEHECEKEDGIAHLQSQIQRLEKENTDFLAALEDAMEQYKQQVKLTGLINTIATNLSKDAHSIFVRSSTSFLSCFRLAQNSSS